MIEICAFSLACARRAADAGADRIELCVGPAEGGLTPSPGLVRETLAAVRIPVFAMLRPRGGDFCYDRHDYAVMARDLAWLREVPVAGIVLGGLLPSGNVDVAGCRQLVELAQPLPCTFHRAFDQTPNLEAALEAVIDAGFSRVLTSGGAATAEAGFAQLRRLVEQAGKRLIVMPGGGVRAACLAGLRSATSATEFHSAATASRGGWQVDADEVRQLVQLRDSGQYRH